jgi:glutathione S-transferase
MRRLLEMRVAIYLNHAQSGIFAVPVQPMKGVPMSLVLFGHPFSSYTQKVLIALFENATPHEFRSLDPGESPEHAAEWLRRWPLRKFPLLVDGERDVAETSIIIEYLQLAHPGAARFLPDDPMAALDVRFLDRFFDLHVMSPVQLAVGGALTGNPERRQEALARATDKLALAYAWLEGRLAGGAWAAGETFTLADCAAAPALFYADWTYPIPEAYPVLRAYRARLLARPSVARAVDGGRPFRHYFPRGAPERD